MMKIDKNESSLKRIAIIFHATQMVSDGDSFDENTLLIFLIRVYVI